MEEKRKYIVSKHLSICNKICRFNFEIFMWNDIFLTIEKFSYIALYGKEFSFDIFDCNFWILDGSYFLLFNLDWVYNPSKCVINISTSDVLWNYYSILIL